MSDNYWNHDNLPKFNQMVLTSKGEEVSFISVYGDQVCLHSETHGLIIRTLTSIKPIPNPNPNPKQSARDKAIAEIVRVATTEGDGTYEENIYDAGYRKVKPMPQNALAGLRCNTNIKSLYKYLIDNGFIIGEE